MTTSQNYLMIKSQQLAQQIQEAEATGKDISSLVKQQIAVLEAHYNEFVKEADEKNIHNLERAKIEIQLCANIKSWAKKIDLPIDSYDERIKQIRISVLGVENTEKFF